MFDGKTEQIGLLTYQTDRRTGDGDRLRRDHFPGHAAGGVCCDQQDIGDANLLGRRSLQRGKERVRRGIRTGQKYPSQPRNGEKKVNA